MNPQEYLFGGTMRLDDGTTIQLVGVEWVAPEVQYLDEQVPDPAWEYTDTNGHAHRWWWAGGQRQGDHKAAQTPTLALATRHVDCDGACWNFDCDGYDVVYRTCIVCGDEVEPGTRAGTVTVETSAAHWSLLTEETSMPRTPAVGRACVQWPSGPGQLMVMNGQATETTSPTQEFRLDERGPVVQRTFRFVQDIRA